MHLHLVDIDPEIVTAWTEAFREFPEVTILEGDILSIAKESIVSPANSYGFMDGGIDRLYTNYFGLRPQQELQTHIAGLQEQLLPVGAATIVKTGNARIPYMIAAPTMQSPGPVPASNSFFAMSAVLNAVSRASMPINQVFCPGLCTGIGAVPKSEAAREMASAFKKWRVQCA